jgi:hypothetical protein
MDKEKASGYSKKYYAAHKEEVAEKNRKWKNANPDKVSKNNKKWRDANPGKVSKAQKKYRDDHPDKISKAHKKRRAKLYFGLSEEEYNNLCEKLFKEQDGKCFICGRPQAQLKNKLGLDHNRRTGQLRGLLCARCNIYFGYVKEDVEVARNIKDYCTKYNIQKIVPRTRRK